MRLIFILTIFATFIFASKIEWVYSLNEAINLAKKENKNIMVFVYANGCAYCEKMKNETLYNKDVARNLNKDFINVALKIDSKEIRENFPQTSVTPTIYFITPNKELLTKVIGYQTLELFFWDLGDVDRALEKLKKGNR